MSSVRPGDSHKTPVTSLPASLATSYVEENVTGNVNEGVAKNVAKPRVDASMFCPNCSTELHAHRCKAICKKCGFYLSCSDPW